MALTTTLWLSSCNYTPTDIYFNQIPQSNGNSPVIRLNNVTKVDTLIVATSTTMNFNITNQSTAIVKVEVSLDGNVIYSTQSAQGSFQIGISPSQYGTFSKLKIDVVTASNTGSLANSLGAESVETWDTWVIQYFSPPPVPTVSTSVKNGFFTLNWTPLPPFYRKYFFNYKLSITYPYQQDIVITDSSVSSYSDSAYVEGMQKTYILTLNVGPGNVMTQPFSMYEPPVMKATFNPSDSVVNIRWSKSKYISAVSGVLIHFDGNLLALKAPADTSLTTKITPLFGQPSTALAYYNLKYPHAYFTGAQASVTLKNPLAQGYLYFGQTPYNGLNLFPQYLFYSKVSDEFVINMGYTTGTGPLRFANLTQHTKDSMNLNSYYNFCMPYPGNYIYTSTSQIGVAQKTITSLPLNGSTFFNGADNQYITTNYNIYDLASNSVVMSLGSQTISDDGKFSLYSSYSGIQVYSLNGNPYTSPASIPSGYYGLRFRPDDCTELYNYSSFTGKISILSSIDGSLKREYTAPSNFGMYNYDPVTKNFLFGNYQYNVVYLLNIDTGVLKQINASGAYCSVLLNGYLFSRDGAYLKII